MHVVAPAQETVTIRTAPYGAVPQASDRDAVCNQEIGMGAVALPCLSPGPEHNSQTTTHRTSYGISP